MTASVGRVLRLGLLNAALDLAHVIEIVGDARAILRRQPALEASRLAGNRIEDAPVLARDAAPAVLGSAVAEQPLERRPRVDLHRQRRRRRRPRDRVLVRAAVAGRAAADVTRVVLGCELDRRELRRLADLAGEHLIDRRADRGSPRPSVCFGTAPLNQPDAAAACISATPPARFRLLTTTSESLSGSSSFERRRQLEVRAGGGRRPRRHVRAVRDVHEPGRASAGCVGFRERASRPAPSHRATAAPARRRRPGGTSVAGARAW